MIRVNKYLFLDYAYHIRYVRRDAKSRKCEKIFYNLKLYDNSNRHCVRKLFVGELFIMNEL